MPSDAERTAACVELLRVLIEDAELKAKNYRRLQLGLNWQDSVAGYEAEATHLRHALAAVEAMAATCVWSIDEGDSVWQAACEPARLWEFTADGPEENGMKHCLYCGKRVEVKYPAPAERRTT